MKFTKSHFEKYVLCHYVSFLRLPWTFQGEQYLHQKHPQETAYRSPSKTPSWLQKYCEVPSKGGTHDTLQDWPREISDFLRQRSQPRELFRNHLTKHRCGVLFWGGGWKCMVKVCVFCVYCLILLLFHWIVSGDLRENCERDHFVPFSTYVLHRKLTNSLKNDGCCTQSQLTNAWDRDITCGFIKKKTRGYPGGLHLF